MRADCGARAAGGGGRNPLCTNGFVSVAVFPALTGTFPRHHSAPALKGLEPGSVWIIPLLLHPPPPPPHLATPPSIHVQARLQEISEPRKKKKIFNASRLSPPGGRWCAVLGFLYAGSVSSSSALQIFRDTSHL